MPLISVLRTFDDAETLESQTEKCGVEVIMMTSELWRGNVDFVPREGEPFHLEYVPNGQPSPNGFSEHYVVTKVVHLHEDAREKDTVPSIFVHVESLPRDAI